MKEKVLVIDDERPTLKMFTLLLSAYGYQVLTAENGREGVETFLRESPGLVLTDIKMPIMDGIEALKAIKKLNPNTEVIVITGHGDMDLAIQALNLDATDFINKPLKREALEKALTRARERINITRNEEGQVVLEEKDRVAVIGVRGNVSSMTLPHLSETFAQAAALGKELILIDFEKNASINGAGITGLTELLREHRGGARIVLAGLSSNFRTVFETLGITKLAEIFDNGEEALASH
ncbi:MAG: response regulator [Pseudodesulfovibrio sp.]|jgi:YesN/AraC family two-component response regulator|uniref:Histidine kinase n=1 Tax=Pseudodesulfovibrio indicus TaxID=1716143 RepID=A0A126QT36_9BACT|nr:response regulator [Pseudodesulfovibrio indicus]AMK12605.1 histidine kinase [Pseudodesulfovibrio indicus]TDT90916.1 response regulator receiver domain-containing protein [Pseudodesulfovibrio indicus]